MIRKIGKFIFLIAVYPFAIIFSVLFDYNGTLIKTVHDASHK
ncbi:hypothetical protein OEV98_14505 [Caldibacillus lycopersici]|uniref:Uncharacterized protein n=1 Tax=Perspicuibacillus lycopersici TaxID=1325689 RepID=A0AAE3IUN1_9BACI|nr:hypothetical protein [Perspicuibacillus lycopersici]MCU9614752.1 hypothetical protein [Perspicuibacillus lycopersici]